MIRAGIIDGAGQYAGELLRLLLHHPDVEVMWVTSAENSPMPIESVHHGLVGDTRGLRFSAEPQLDKVDVIFLAGLHGKAKEWLEENKESLSPDVKIIDLSGDYRSPDENHDFVYGLPELNRKPMVRGAIHVANPGSFAMAVELALLPLAKAQLLNNDIHITGIAGSTADANNPAANMDYSWRNDNVAVFKPFTHRHLPEINRVLTELQPDFSAEVNFVPMRGPFSRGLMVTLYTVSDLDVEDVKKMYEEYYDDHNFTYIIDRLPDLKDVANTNKCLINIQRVGNKLLVTAVIDNLLKGAAGNAVHIMNLLFGLHERTGLELKPTAF